MSPWSFPRLRRSDRHRTWGTQSSVGGFWWPGRACWGSRAARRQSRILIHHRLLLTIRDRRRPQPTIHRRHRLLTIRRPHNVQSGGPSPRPKVVCPGSPHVLPVWSQVHRGPRSRRPHSIGGSGTTARTPIRATTRASGRMAMQVTPASHATSAPCPKRRLRRQAVVGGA